MKMKQQFSFEYTHYESVAALSEADRALVEAAREATQKAHAPYSHFHVGAAARLKSGRILTGSNIESEVYPAGLCAERTLLFHHAACHAADPIEALAIASVPDERECYPCGQCRQVLVDTERRQKSPMRILMCGRESITEVDSAERLLPFTFIL
jgi:cytidine deaminase